MNKGIFELTDAFGMNDAYLTNAYRAPILGPAASVMHNFWNKWRLGHYLALSAERGLSDNIWSVNATVLARAQIMHQFARGAGNTLCVRISPRAADIELRLELRRYRHPTLWRITYFHPLDRIFLRASCRHRQSTWRD